MTQLLVSTRKGLFIFERESAGAWRMARSHFSGDRVSLSLVDPRDGTFYAALDHGHFGVKLHRSDDGGVTFEEIAAPAYPAKPEGVEDKDSAGKEVPWNVELIWSLAAGGDDEPGALWCGTIPGGLFRSADRGETWHLVESLWRQPARKSWFGGGYDWPGIHSICVDPRDSKRVLIGISCGGAWQTRDRGETWALCASGMYAAYMPPDRRDDESIQDPHCIVQCKSAPDTFWTQHHNGVFCSTNDAASWTEIDNVPPSTFGFAVAVHPGDPKTAWLIPAISDEHRVPVEGKLVVARTRDGGASFDTLTQGLPQAHAYDLVFRHALDVDSSGDIAAFGSTTGNLWVTEDQGDSWTVISHHLPPIAAVDPMPARRCCSPRATTRRTSRATPLAAASSCSSA